MSQVSSMCIVVIGLAPAHASDKGLFSDGYLVIYLSWKMHIPKFFVVLFIVLMINMPLKICLLGLTYKGEA